MVRGETGFSNLLLVSIEDLNDWIEPLRGHPDALTPHLQRFADRGVLFENAFATTPACSPSRTAALFSRAPWKTGVLTNDQKWYDHFPANSTESVVGQLRRNGFNCYGSGKVFHPAGKNPDGDYDGFSAPAKIRYPAISSAVKAGDMGAKADFGVDPTGEPSFDDLHVADAIAQMVPGAERQVWTVGIFRPHLPFVAPKEFFDRLPEQVSIPPGLRGNAFDATSGLETAGLPGEAMEFVRQYSHDGEALQKHGEYNAFLRAYLASVAYADDLFGKLLDRLEETGLDRNTLVVVWSDHGWQLGEKLAFRKFTLWERSLRIPLMFAGPGIAAGRRDAVASLLDLGPTVLDLMGVDIPDAYHGVSLKPAILDRNAPDPRATAVSAWTIRRGLQPRSAVTVRNRAYRYIRYWNGGEELYAHPADPHEKTNLLAAGEAEARGIAAAELAAFRETAEDILAQIDAVTPKKDRPAGRAATKAGALARAIGRRLVETAVKRNSPAARKKHRRKAKTAITGKSARAVDRKERRRTAEATPDSGSRLPDFICIGAQKAGTAWLSQILAQHPGAWNPGVKEIHYFDRTKDGRVPPKLAERLVARIRAAEKSRDLDLPHGLTNRIQRNGLGFEEYLKLFSQAPAGKLVWEITPAYSSMDGPRIDQMLAALPETKFIYLIRDPLTRTESSLRMALERSDRTLGRKPPHDKVARDWLENDKAVSRADYSDSIPRWDERLEGSGRLLYLPFGMIKTDPAGMVRKIEEFLGLEPFDGYEGLTEPYHPTRKIELPDFAVAEIAQRMEPHRAFLRERFGEEFAALT